MLEGFEEAFVDAQSRVVSLCLELLKNSEKKADKIYISISKWWWRLYRRFFWKRRKFVYYKWVVLGRRNRRFFWLRCRGYRKYNRYL